ncbi:MAG TPA: DoxX family protein [Anaerolineae bacterium]|nr:DoxX family protein [Anaerolineae bacterium]
MLPQIGLLILRVTIGLLFAAHGAQKLFGWFGGSGIDGHANLLASMGLQPSRLWAAINALAEFGGGLLMVLGILTPVAAAVLIAAMVMAIIKVHWPRGFWNKDGGYEFPLTLIAATMMIGLAGPGAGALNPAVFAKLPQLQLFEVSLVISLIGVAIGLITGLRQPYRGRRIMKGR